ncbi:RNA polymerase sigma-70 factor [Streptomyces sp. MZ04]|uniref:RNA polymerase sigma-70 factor n=1 Tax=Streptomyces sp. MZ04 TaxID=2559236 RepID=UPI002474225C|nr:RNA polymerase sigma-70 factor [Streptomyces sp. MZ04]
MTTAALADEFESHRPRMFSLAYRMLGSAQEAEDTVQDAYLRWSGARRDDIGQPAAWLAKVVTNLCLNRLTSARARREQYVGPWLPEPVITSGGALGPLESAEQRDAVSMALLILLERLTPVERAVFVLREAFAYSHREIAGVLDIGEANCRQLYRRATRAVAGEQTRFEAAAERRQKFVESFIAAARDGDLAGLEKVLAADVTWWGDGGGKVTAARRPIVGREKVLRFLVGGMENFGGAMDLSYAEVNGAPAIVATVEGTVVGTATFEFRDDGLVSALRTVVNPDKLGFVAGQLSHS